MKRALDASLRAGTTKSAVLCRDTVNIRSVWGYDIGQSCRFGSSPSIPEDSRTWENADPGIGFGCGYRNALMLISSLIMSDPPYAQIWSKDDNGAPPGTRRLQGWIEEAWKEGYDPVGRDHFKGKLLGTRKWIGTSGMSFGRPEISSDHAARPICYVQL